MQWLTDVLFNAAVADQYPAFLVQNADVLGLFGWEQRERKDFSFAEFSPFLKQIDDQGALAEKVESVQRSAYQSAVVNLRNALVLYQRLKNSIQPEGEQNFATELNALRDAMPARDQRETEKNPGQQKLNDVATLIQRYEKVSAMAYILAVPPATASNEWHSMSESVLHSAGSGELHQIVGLRSRRRRLSRG